MQATLSQVHPQGHSHILELCDPLQKDELYALQAIYLTDFEFNRAAHPYQFTIIVKPFVPPEYFFHQNLVFARITIELPVDYPLVKQSFLFEIEGLSTHFTREFTKKATDLCENYLNQREKEALDKEYGEARGPIIFGFVESLREWLFDQSVNYQDLYESTQKQISENSLYIPTMPKFSTFTTVTIESFLQWKKKFDAEIFEAKRRQKSFTQEEEFMTKLTGKYYFEKVREKTEKQEIDEEVLDDDAVELEEDDYDSSDGEEDQQVQNKRLYDIENQFD